MARLQQIVSLAAVALVAGCADHARSAAPTAPDNPRLAASSSSAVMEFGVEGVGSGYPPTSGHDASAHASDKVHPRTVTIARGGTVTFEIDPFHDVAIYRDGTRPEDIEVSPATLQPLVLGPVFIPDFITNDPDGRIALGPGYSFGEQVWTSAAFTQPGTYLVICTTTPHFVEAKMYGWIVVK